ncbi:rod shape-determining protein RodA [soil metagenome]
MADFNSGFQIQERGFLKKLDWNFIVPIITLHVIGIINLYSATHGLGAVSTDRLFLSQVFWLLKGWVVFLGVTLVDYQFFIRAAYLLYVLNLIALFGVMFFGKVALGAQRWLDLGIFSYQPSESMKLALVLVLAKLLSQKSFVNGMGLKDLAFPLLILVGVPFLVTAEQPDLGTAMMLLIIGTSVLFFVRIRRAILVALTAVTLMGITGAWFFGLRDYQKHRIYTFLDPMRDPRGKGYNSIQSKIAVGSGQVIGKGFRKGTQSQLEFLPERHTDFIFSVLSEEWGFLGSFFTISVFGLLFAAMVRIAAHARDKAGALLTVGVTATLFWHMFVNVSMVIGLLPIVGIPLPLLSYGGSNMLTTMAALGLVSSVSYRKYLF